MSVVLRCVASELLEVIDHVADVELLRETRECQLI